MVKQINKIFFPTTAYFGAINVSFSYHAIEVPIQKENWLLLIFAETR
jgi:hypothetical protein